MKKTLCTLTVASTLFWGTAAHAVFVSGSTGADGAFNPTANTTVVLPPDGALNYTTVNIPAGVTVTFQKNAANTPVYMLATGDVTIAGTISINGSGGTLTIPGTGGPGGFDGGYGGGLNNINGGKGFGPGGGNPGAYYDGNGGGGGFGASGTSGNNTNAGTGGVTYGNAKLTPLIGGSGGGGAGGSLSNTATPGGGGSGGAIKLVSNVISGNGTISAAAGSGSQYSTTGGLGGAGRIRIEAFTNNRTAPTAPQYSYGLPSSIFVSNPPSLTITSIGGTPPPASPTGKYNQPDILLPSSTTNPVAVNVSATNIPDGTTVSVWVIPQFGNATSVNATLSGSTASTNVNLSTIYSNVVTAQATFTITAMYYDGEEIDKVRVATTLGGGSETTYITKSGKEIKGELVAALGK